MKTLNHQNENTAVQKALEPWIKKLIREETKNCVRRRTLTVVTPPNGETMGVQDVYDPTVMDLPYRAEAADAQVGDTVTIEWLYGLSNAVVISAPRRT